MENHLPQPVKGLVSGVTAIAAGTNHTCAVIADEVWCWGAYYTGELGNGSTTNSAVPVRVAFP